MQFSKIKLVLFISTIFLCSHEAFARYGIGGLHGHGGGVVEDNAWIGLVLAVAVAGFSFYYYVLRKRR